MKTHRFRYPVLFLLIIFLLAGCAGTESEPVVELETVMPTDTPIPATETAVPTDTSIPPTDTPEPTVTPVNFVETYQRYFNNHDLDGLLTLYADDVICENCGSHVTHVQGKEALTDLFAHELAVNPTIKLQFCTETGSTTTCSMIYQNDLLTAAGLDSVVYTAVNFSFVEGLIQTESHVLGQNSTAALDHIWHNFYPWATASYPAEANQLFDETGSYIPTPENAVLITSLLPEWLADKPIDVTIDETIVITSPAEPLQYLDIAYPEAAPISDQVVIFQSNLFAQYTGVTISFQLPREWQADYWSDSGAFGWVISDAEPSEVFWYANRTFDELLLGAMLFKPDDSDDPASTQFNEFKNDAILSSTELVEFEVNSRLGAYKLSEGEISGMVIKDQMILMLFGDYPEGKETAYKDGIDTIFKTWDWVEIPDMDFSALDLFGNRLEGQLTVEHEMEGHIAMHSVSEWILDGATDQIVAITIDAQNQEVSQIMGDGTDILEAKLFVDILDENGESILASGLISFTGHLEQEPIQLPSDGIYFLRVYAQDEWYGRYKISLD